MSVAARAGGATKRKSAAACLSAAVIAGALLSSCGVEEKDIRLEVAKALPGEGYYSLLIQDPGQVVVSPLFRKLAERFGAFREHRDRIALLRSSCPGRPGEGLLMVTMEAPGAAFRAQAFVGSLDEGCFKTFLEKSGSEGIAEVRVHGRSFRLDSNGRGFIGIDGMIVTGGRELLGEIVDVVSGARPGFAVDLRFREALTILDFNAEVSYLRWNNLDGILRRVQSDTRSMPGGAGVQSDIAALAVAAVNAKWGGDLEVLVKLKFRGFDNAENLRPFIEVNLQLLLDRFAAAIVERLMPEGIILDSSKLRFRGDARVLRLGKVVYVRFSLAADDLIESCVER